MAPQQSLRIGAQPRLGRFEVGNRLPAPHDGEVLTPVLDSVEEVREVAGCFSGAHVRHADQIIR